MSKKEYELDSPENFEQSFIDNNDIGDFRASGADGVENAGRQEIIIHNLRAECVAQKDRGI